MNKKILGILPESIGGRLTIASLFQGFKNCGFEVFIIDKLNLEFKKNIKDLNFDEYDFILGYDFVAIEFKTDLGLNIKTVNYFSDVIESDCSGAYREEYCTKLKDKDNFIFYWDKELCEEQNENFSCYYLPHCVDTGTYKNLNQNPDYEVMFAGRLTYKGRLKRFLNLIKSLPSIKFALYCFEKHLNEACENLSAEDAKILKTVYKGFINNEEEMNTAINKSAIVINFTSQGKSSLNYRLFQVLACEKLLLTDFRNEINELFTPQKDIIFYQDDNDLIEKIKDYFEHPTKYQEIIKQGRKTIENKYSSTKAAEFILGILANSD